MEGQTATSTYRRQENNIKMNQVLRIGGGCTWLRIISDGMF
jgi:hypothetical protein